MQHSHRQINSSVSLCAKARSFLSNPLLHSTHFQNFISNGPSKNDDSKSLINLAYRIEDKYEKPLLIEQKVRMQVEKIKQMCVLCFFHILMLNAFPRNSTQNSGHLLMSNLNGLATRLFPKLAFTVVLHM
jgi:hypothetical protein